MFNVRKRAVMMLVIMRMVMVVSVVMRMFAVMRVHMPMCMVVVMGMLVLMCMVVVMGMLVLMCMVMFMGMLVLMCMLVNMMVLMRMIQAFLFPAVNRHGHMRAGNPAFDGRYFLKAHAGQIQRIQFAHKCILIGQKFYQCGGEHVARRAHCAVYI